MKKFKNKNTKFNHEERNINKLASLVDAIDAMDIWNPKLSITQPLTDTSKSKKRHKYKYKS